MRERGRVRRGRERGEERGGDRGGEREEERGIVGERGGKERE